MHAPGEPTRGRMARAGERERDSGGGAGAGAHAALGARGPRQGARLAVGLGLNGW